MAETRIYSRIKSHQDADGDWLPEPGSDTDTHTIVLLAGQKFARYDLMKLEGGCSVKSVKEADGVVTIEVDWYHLPLERARYHLRGYAGDIKAVKIAFGSNAWFERARDVIKQGLPLDITVSGPDARELWRQLSLLPGANPNLRSRSSLARVFDDGDEVDGAVVHDSGGAPTIPRLADDPGGPIRLAAPTPEGSAADPSGGMITVSIIAILAGTVMFAILAWLLKEAIDAGYFADADFTGGNPPQVNIVLKPGNG
ncbi:MAG: hypothetical protein HGA45_23665 [Chloroflexales bacterium]|nr:hypothetical protein [Chloroflexales bacterium]